MLVVKNPPANAGKNIGDEGSIPGLGKSHGEGHGNRVQNSWSGESPWTEEPGIE